MSLHTFVQKSNDNINLIDIWDLSYNIVCVFKKYKQKLDTFLRLYIQKLSINYYLITN